MAPPPEYDKEPKAPDKCALTNAAEDPPYRQQHNDHQIHFDSKSSTPANNTDAKDNKDVETLDDGQLRALLDEAITYKCPKDREGKSSLFKELLEEVEQDEQACEAAARTRRGAGASNSLQDLVAALAAEPAPRRHRPAPRDHHASSSVSARTHHGGSLPSGVDTSFLLGEEPVRVGYVATVRCVNPAPLSERRVSASDAPPPPPPSQPDDADRSKMSSFPMTYTARATLEIGSGGAPPGRAVTTTTASNQVRTDPAAPPPRPAHVPPAPAPPAQRLLDALRPRPRDGAARTNSYNTREPTHTNCLDHADQTGGDLSTCANETVILSARTNCLVHADVTSGDLGTGANENLILSGNNKKPKKLPSQASKLGTEAKCDDDKETGAPKEAVINKSCDNKISSKKSRRKTKVGKDSKSVSRETTISYHSRDITNMPKFIEETFSCKNEIDNNVTNEISPYGSFLPEPAAPQAPCRPPRPIRGPPELFYSQWLKDANRPYRQKFDHEIAFMKEHKKTRTYEKFHLISNEKVKTEEYNNSSLESKDSYENEDIHMKTNSERYYWQKINSQKLVAFELSSLNPKNVRPMSLGKPPPQNSAVHITATEVNKTNDCSYRGDDKSAAITDSAASAIVGDSAPHAETCGEGRDRPTGSDFIDRGRAAPAEVAHSTVSGPGCAADEHNAIKIDMDPASREVEAEAQEDVSRETVPIITQQDSSLPNDDDEGDAYELKDVSYEIFRDNLNNSRCFQKQELLRSLESAEGCPQSSASPRQSNVSNELVISFNESTYGVTEEEELNHVPYQKTGTQCPEVEMKSITMLEPEYLFAVKNDVQSVDRSNNASFFATQQQLLKTLKYAEDANNNTTGEKTNLNKIKVVEDDRNSEGVCRSVTIDMEGIVNEKSHKVVGEVDEPIEEIVRSNDIECVGEGEREGAGGPRARADQYVLAELPNNAYVFLTFPKPHALTNNNPDNSNTRPRRPLQTKKLKEPPKETKTKKSLREMLLETLMKDGGASGSAKPTVKVDSGIPFSCITTPEVVTNCNTTSSTQSSAIAVDSKPRAAGPAAPAAADEHKKSLDENGNSVQGSGSPLSSQQKKPRRKKTSKNETVIKSHQIDGYQGNKDLNELLRFIECGEGPGGQGGRRLRAKRDDDDKGKKRRKDKERAPRASSLDERCRPPLAELVAPAPSAPLPAAVPERRSWGDDAFYYQPAPAPAPAPPTPAKEKKKNKPSLEQTILADPPAETALELLDFQTVTKKKKQRRRTEEGTGPTGTGRRAASPGRRRTAPPSDKSNDSNDDLDSEHSAPDAAPDLPAPRGASYADIARTRHNIPDLIESCNYYADGEPERAPVPPLAAPVPAPAYDADSYPALARRGGGGAARGKAPPAVAPAPCPAPDVVVADRPAVILLDEASRARDLEGVTFGFDVNEQLLGGGRRRCDLVPAAEPAPCAASPACPAPRPASPPAVRVRDNLRYRPPPAPAPPAASLRPIVDYVGNAWEDIMKCGGGKVRYFAE